MTWPSNFQHLSTMNRQPENNMKPLQAKQIALLVIPPDQQNTDLWCSPMAGMTFIVRQARLASRANVSSVWIICPSTLTEMASCVPDQHYAPELKILSYDTETEGPDTVLSTLPRAGRYIVFSSDCVYDHKLFAGLANYDPKNQQNCLAITSDNKKQPIWICDAQSLPLAVKTVSTPESSLPDNILAFETDLPVYTVTCRNDLKKLENRLWDQCRKDIDGLVSTWVNRHISLAISKRIINTTITPNQVTVFAVLLGILAALIAASGNYWAVLIGAGLLQISSIIDGVDGEIARMRVQSSVMGEWLDTIGDDVVNICFVLAIGYGAHQTGADIVWSYMAILCATLMFSISAIYYVWLARAGRGDILSTDWFQSGDKLVASESAKSHGLSSLKTTVYAWATKLFRRDLLIAIIFLTALAGVVHYSLLIFIPASLATLAAQLVKMFDGKK